MQGNTNLVIDKPLRPLKIPETDFLEKRFD